MMRILLNPGDWLARHERLCFALAGLLVLIVEAI